MLAVLVALLFASSAGQYAQAAPVRIGCEIKQGSKPVGAHLGDPLARILARAPTCPQDIVALKKVLASDGLDVTPAMVANRGFHNPEQGSFSFFETVEGHSAAMGATVEKGQFFLGHFTVRSGSSLSLDMAPVRGKLLIELIAFDARKGMFNFYELIGDGTKGAWFYRGDSADALADNAFVHRAPAQGSPKFGDRMRCSACHTAGEPIMKEIAAPHNDWWRVQRPLPFGSAKPDAHVSDLLLRLEDASAFSEKVKLGMNILFASEGYAAAASARSLQERVRPLFCATTVNIASDLVPRADAVASLTVPQGFLAHPFLVKGRTLEVDRAHYKNALSALEIRFPENNDADADHGFLAPVVARVDEQAIDALMDEGVVDVEFAADVLAIDAENPLFSKERCDLLRFVPNAEHSLWKVEFGTNLKAAADAGQASARALLENLNDTTRTFAFHAAAREHDIARLQDDVRSPQGVLALVKKLVDARARVFVDEISKNPRGQILEPGFRVIFPVPMRTGRLPPSFNDP